MLRNSSTATNRDRPGAACMMDEPSQQVLLEVRASDGRVYRLVRTFVPGGAAVHQLTLPQHEWPERFKKAAQFAFFGAIVTTVVPAVLVYTKLWLSPHGDYWLARDLTQTLVTCLAASGIVTGFPIGLFLANRPHRFAATFTPTMSLK